MSSPSPMERTQPPGVTIFVSYAHEDRRWLKEGSLVPRLLKSRILGECHARIVVDQEFLHGGDDWERMIRREIDQCHIAVLLVSRPFLDSRFIREVELKRIEERARQSGVLVIPILVGHCDWKSVPLLSTPQMLPGGPTPLITFLNDEAALDRAFDEIISEIELQVQRLHAAPPKPPQRTAAQAELNSRTTDPPPSGSRLTNVQGGTWVRWAVIGGTLLCAIALAIVLWQRHSPEDGQDPRAGREPAGRTNVGRATIEPTPGDPSAGQDTRTATESPLSPNGLFPARLLLVSGEEVSGGMLVDHNPGGFGNGWNMKTLGYCTTLAEAANQPRNRTRQLDYAGIARIDLVAFDPAEQAAVAEMYYYDRDKIMKANVTFRDGTAKSGVYLLPHYLRYQTANERMDLRRDQLRAIMFTPISSGESHPTLAATSVPPAAPRSAPLTNPAPVQSSQSIQLIRRHTFAGHGDKLRYAAISEDNTTLLSIAEDRVVRLWSTDNGQLLETLERSNKKPPEPHFRQGSYYHPLRWKPARPIETASASFWRAMEAHTLQLPDGTIFQSDGFLSPDGQWLAVTEGVMSGGIEAWKAGAEAPTWSLEGSGYHVASITFSLDSRLLLAGAHDGCVRLWNLQTGEKLRTLGKQAATGQGPSVLRLCLGPDGQTLAAAETHGGIRLWDLQSFRQTSGIYCGRGGWVTALAFSPDGELLFANQPQEETDPDFVIRIYRLPGGDALATLPAHQGPIAALAVSGDGKWLVSGSEDETAVLWQIERTK
ncbi:MAG: TIR domain-containing protein [Verrucomicrobia bacterium]|nr:TIR domain-containing protein [Verrucomicrobiota bacterium]